MTVSLIDVSTYLPGEPVGADYYAQFAESDDLRDNLMFRAPKFRHHVAPGRDRHRHGRTGRRRSGGPARPRRRSADVDVLITHTQLPDMPFYGGGGGMAHRLGMKPNWVIDLHNGGCAAFVLALKLARTPDRVRRGTHRADRRRAERGGTGLRSADRPAQGAGVGARRRSGGRAGDRVGRVADPRRRVPHLRRVRRRHDARRRSAAQVVAGRARARAASASPKARSPRCWPGATGRCPRWPTRCATESDWRPRTSTCWSPTSRTGCSCATGVRRWSCPQERHVDTFDECGNLFAAGIPVNLDRAISRRRSSRRATS